MLKSLYGLKQASRHWNLKLTEILLGAGFSQSVYDYSLFTKKSGNGIVIILIYVDDLLLLGSSIELINEAKSVLHKQFKVKHLGELRYFLGIKVLRSHQGILLNQRKYTLELFQSWD